MDAIKKVEANRRLRGNRRRLWDRDVTPPYSKGEVHYEFPEPPEPVRRRFREQFANERRQENLFWFLAVVVVFVLCGVYLTHIAG